MDPKELANRMFVTCYMGSENSSEDTRSRAKNLAQDIGSYHMGKDFMYLHLQVYSVMRATHRKHTTPDRNSNKQQQNNYKQSHNSINSTS